MLDNLFIDTHFPKLSHTRHDTDLEKSIKFGQMFLPSDNKAKIVENFFSIKNWAKQFTRTPTHGNK